MPHAISLRIRRWVGRDRPQPCRPIPMHWQRQSGLTFASMAGIAFLSVLMPAAPGPALVEGVIDFDAVAEPESLISLLANNESPIFATAGTTNPLVVDESPRGRYEPRGGFVPGTLTAPNPSIASILPPEPAQRGVPPEGLVHVVTQGENLWEICRRYRVKMDDVIAWNGLAKPDRLSLGTRLFLPGASTPTPLQMVSPMGRTALRFTSRYGMRVHPILKRRRFHKGLDMGGRRGTPVCAVMDGVVVKARRDPQLGLFVRVRHADGLETVYGHCTKLLVKRGQQVSSGQQVGTLGSTGLATAPHLHFEVWKDNRHTNPIAYLQHLRKTRK